MNKRSYARKANYSTLYEVFQYILGRLRESYLWLSFTISDPPRTWKKLHINFFWMHYILVDLFYTSVYDSDLCFSRKIELCGKNEYTTDYLEKEIIWNLGRFFHEKVIIFSLKFSSLTFLFLDPTVKHFRYGVELRIDIFCRRWSIKYQLVFEMHLDYKFLF